MGSVQNHLRDDLTKGEQLFEQGKIKESEETFSQIISEYPGNIEALNNLGVISYTKNKYQDAINYWLSGLEKNPNHSELLDNLIGSVQDPQCYHYLNSKLNKYLQKKYIRSSQRDILLSFAGSLNIDIGYKSAVRSFDITPELSEENGVYLQGYASPNRLATSAITPLTLQILLIEDYDYNKLLIITADLFGFDDSIVESVQNNAIQWGIPPGSVILNASHTHYAPGTVNNLTEILGPYYENYANQISQLIVQNLEGIYNDLEPCLIYYGETDAKIGDNRRLPTQDGIQFGLNKEGFYQKHTPYLILDLLKTGKRLVAFNHSCHPTGYGAHNQVSADYPAYVREYLKNNDKITEVMFLQGAAGTAKQSSHDNSEAHFTSTPEEVIKNSINLGSALENSMAEDLPLLKGEIRSDQVKTEFRFDEIPTLKELKDTADYETQNVLKKAWAEKLLGSEEYRKESLTLNIQKVQFGESFSIVSLPGEPVAELGELIIESLPQKKSAFVLGYTNGLKAYLPTDEQISEGGYESDESKYVYNLPSSFAQGFEKDIISAVKDLNEQLSDGEVSLNDPAFFSLSSGRCGTQTLATILNTASNAKVYHHPLPYLVNETLEAYHEKINRWDVFWRARSGVIKNAWKNDDIFGELDHNMTPFVPEIAKKMPNSKFIILVRNPWDFVRSGMRRNYYNGHPWDSGRLRPEPTHPDFERWENMSQFEKVCWLWNETYKRILHYLKSIPEDRYTIIKFEDLVSDTEATERIFNFLGLEGFSPKKIDKIIYEPINKQISGHFPKVNEWSQQLKTKLWNLCSDQAIRFDYSKKISSNSHNKNNEKVNLVIPKKNQVPLLGVGLPIYNAEKYVAQAIESILEQDFDDIQLIISDNGSNDNTKNICEDYERKTPSKVKYFRYEKNLGAVRNFQRAANLSKSPYFMWASYDDLHDSQFIPQCMNKIQSDESAVLVYTQSKIVDKNSNYIGMGEDNLNAETEDPIERYKNVVSYYGMCNAFYGVYRKSILDKTNAFYKHLYRGYDNLLLAELALLGKIIQIEEPLFIRRLTRDYSESLEENNANLIKTLNPNKISEGIILPYCRFAFAHLEMLSQSQLLINERSSLIDFTSETLTDLYRAQMDYEIGRVIQLIKDGIYYYEWDGTLSDSVKEINNTEGIIDFFAAQLIKNISEALYLFPENEGLRLAYRKCIEVGAKIKNFEEPV